MAAMSEHPFDNLRIDGDRLWQSLMEMAEIGATEKGGVCRLTLTDEDKEGRDLFVRWCEDAGCSVTVDKLGNIFARRPGKNETLAPIMTGSHLDSQPSGGKFDGAFGVLAGLEVIRTLNDHGVETEAPVEVSVWTNEEGSRFAPSMVASNVFVGVHDLDFALACADLDGKTMGEELARIGYAGDEPVGGRPIGAFFETHIEQGPILEAEGKTIGVVTGVQGIHWFDASFTGRESHAGPTPMAVRRDSLLGAARVVEGVNRMGHAHQPGACATVGHIQAWPNSRNVIPGRTTMQIDLRHPDAGTLARMGEELGNLVRDTAAELTLEWTFEQVMDSAPVVFNADCVDAVRGAAERAGYSSMDIVSGAGHDACAMSKVAPTAMVFVPCADGISHNELESATPEDLAAGCNVLFHAMLERALAGQD
jgi:beta-ureidopropionase / N-carbamoyl-L-amino-acid hydrolase